MNDMVERVARAIIREFPGDCAWGDAVAMARAAIAAMREPTEAIRDAAGKLISTQHLQADIWRAMIDAALKP